MHKGIRRLYIFAEKVEISKGNRDKQLFVQDSWLSSSQFESSSCWNFGIPGFVTYIRISYTTDMWPWRSEPALCFYNNPSVWAYPVCADQLHRTHTHRMLPAAFIVPTDRFLQGNIYLHLAFSKSSCTSGCQWDAVINPQILQTPRTDIISVESKRSPKSSTITQPTQSHGVFVRSCSCVFFSNLTLFRFWLSHHTSACAPSTQTYVQLWLNLTSCCVMQLSFTQCYLLIDSSTIPLPTDLSEANDSQQILTRTLVFGSTCWQ